VQFILPLKLRLYTTVHLLLEEFKNVSQVILKYSIQSCHTISPTVGVGVWSPKFSNPGVGGQGLLIPAGITHRLLHWSFTVARTTYLRICVNLSLLSWNCISHEDTPVCRRPWRVMTVAYKYSLTYGTCEMLHRPRTSLPFTMYYSQTVSTLHES